MNKWKKIVILVALAVGALAGWKAFSKPDMLPPGQYRVTYLKYSGAASDLTIGTSCKKSCRKGKLCGDLDGTGDMCHKMCEPESESVCGKTKVCGPVTDINDTSREVLMGICVTPL